MSTPPPRPSPLPPIRPAPKTAFYVVARAVVTIFTLNLDVFRGMSSRLVASMIAASVMFGANGTFKEIFHADSRQVGVGLGEVGSGWIG